MLTHVEGAAVASPQQAADAMRGLQAAALTFADVGLPPTVQQTEEPRGGGAAPAEAAGEISVTLQRQVADKWLPLGLQVDARTLELNGLGAGSIAAASPELRGLVGATLTKVNGVAVRSPADIMGAVEGGGPITLHFRDPAAQQGKGEGGAHHAAPPAAAPHTPHSPREGRGAALTQKPSMRDKARTDPRIPGSPRAGEPPRPGSMREKATTRGELRSPAHRDSGHHVAGIDPCPRADGGRAGSPRAARGARRTSLQ
eukprot:gene45298-31138_t